MSRNRPVILGMDGGGTGTTTWLADADGNVLGRGHAGASNIRAVGPNAAMTELDLSILTAFQSAGLEPSPIEVSCLGLAGYDRPEDQEWLRLWAAESQWAGRLILVTDGDLVVAAGTPDGWGVGIIAGTGSIAVGRSRDGVKARAGGWGHLIGDEGSGYHVAIQALRRIARFTDGRDARGASGPDPLTERLCLALGVRRSSEIIGAIYQERMTRSRIAALAVDVVAAAEADPSIAKELLEPAGMELAAQVMAVARGIGVEKEHLPLAMAGSFLLGCSTVSKVMLNRLAEAGYFVHPTPVPRPVEGALVLARQELMK